jgi:hypothetical protein
MMPAGHDHGNRLQMNAMRFYTLGFALRSNVSLLTIFFGCGFIYGNLQNNGQDHFRWGHDE